MYESAHRSTLDPETAARVMGFAGKSGASAVALGAVRQFGLVDGLRGSMRISDLALRILQPSSQQEELAARREAASKPEIYSGILSHFQDELPKSDEPIKAFLIRSMGFSQSGAEDCISSLRKTLDETSLIDPKEEESFMGISQSDHKIGDKVQRDTPESIVARPSAENEFVRIPLARDCYAELRLFGAVTDSAVDRLIQYIELMKGAWAES